MAKKSKEDLMKHFNMRLLQRWGINISLEQVEEINRLIQEGKTEHLGRTSNSRTAHRVTWGGVEFIVYYDKPRSTVVTVLEDDMHLRVIDPPS